MATLVRFDPLDVLRDLERRFDAPAPRARRWSPRLDVFERDAGLVVRVEIPGVPVEALEVTAENDTLTISGRRAFAADERDGAVYRKEIVEGEFTRTVRLPEGVDAEAITAASHDGILEIAVPRRPEVLPRKIDVEVTR